MIEEIELRIKEIREHKGYSLSELSRMTNISKAYLSQLERGKFKSPSVFVMLKIAVVLEVSIYDLIGDWKFNGKIVEKKEKTLEFTRPAPRRN